MIHDPAPTSAKLRPRRPGADRGPGAAAPLLAVLYLAGPGLLALGSAGARAGAPASEAGPGTAAGPALIDPDDRLGATRVQVDADLTPSAAPARPVKGPGEEAEEPTAPAVGAWSVTAHGRYVTLPGFVLDSVYADHPSFGSVGAGAAVEYGDPRSASWVLELDWTRIGIAGANWRERGVPAGAATYAEVGLQLLSLDVSYRWAFRLGGPVDAVVGLGLGLGGLLGDIQTAEVLPNCVEPIDQCPHWREASHATVDLPTRVVPIVHVAVGAQAALGDDGLVRVMVGFRDAPYVGLSAGLRL